VTGLAPLVLSYVANELGVAMEERKVVEKRTEITKRESVEDPKVTNINIGPDGSTQIQEESDLVDDPVGSTVIRQEEVIEKESQQR
jgi:hypothetical protein